MSTLESQQSSSGRRPTVYETLHAYTHYAHRDDAGGQSLPSEKSRRQQITHILAPSQRLAEAMWHESFDYPDSENELLSCTPLHTIDLFVEVRRGVSL